jgi:hypothetical protein
MIPDLTTWAERLQSECTPALATELIHALAFRADILEQRAARNRLLRRAADMVEGTRYLKAKRVLVEVLAVEGPSSEFRQLVRLALALSPRVPPITSQKQLERVLE